MRARSLLSCVTVIHFFSGVTRHPTGASVTRYGSFVKTASSSSLPVLPSHSHCVGRPRELDRYRLDPARAAGAFFLIRFRRWVSMSNIRSAFLGVTCSLRGYAIDSTIHFFLRNHDSCFDAKILYLSIHQAFLEYFRF